MEFTKKELATFAGYTYRRLYDIDAGLPAEKKLFVQGEGGKYDLALFVQRWVKYNTNKEASAETNLNDAKTQHEIIKTRKTQLEVDRLEGKLVDVQEIQRLWATVATTLVQNFLRMPSKISPRLVLMKDANAISAIIENAVRDVLVDVSETPLPQDVERCEEDGEDEEEEG